MRRIVLLAVVALATGFAPAPFPKKERFTQRDDLDPIQGLWLMTSYTSGGRDTGREYKIRIKGNNWTFISTSAGQERESGSYAYYLDYTVSPRAFEWTYDANRINGWVGSYRLENGGKNLT